MITGQHAGETAEVCRTNHRRSRGVVDLGRGPDKTHGYRCRSDGSDRSTHAGDHITGSIDNLVVGVVE